MVKLFVLLSTFTLAVSAQVQSSIGLFNVTSPTVNAPYVASRVLPCIYTVASNATSDSKMIILTKLQCSFALLDLQLSISLSNGSSAVVIDASADISQGYSFQKDQNGATVYEHQFNVS